MLDIAATLEAKVSGDDGEEYRKTAVGFESISDGEPPNIIEWRHKPGSDEFETIVRSNNTNNAGAQTRGWPGKLLILVLVVISGVYLFWRT